MDPDALGGPRRGARLGPWVAAAVALAMAASYHATTLESGKPSLLNLDDGYIHARLGENLARHGKLGINAGEAGGGSSSLAWTLLVATGSAAGPGGALTCGLLSIVGLALAVGLASRFAFEVLPPPYAWGASIAVAGCGQTAALSLSGMESLLFAALVLAGLRDAASGRRLHGGLFFAAAALVRTEAVLAALAVTLAGGARRSFRARQLALTMAAATAGIVGLTLLGGSLPATLGARRWLYGMGESLVPGAEQWTGPIASLVTHLWTRLAAFVGPGGKIGHAWAVSVVVLLAIGAARMWASGKLAHLPVYGALHAAFVVLVLGDDGQLGRYGAPLWILAPLLVASGFHWMYGRWGKAASIAPLLFLAALYVPQTYRWAGWHRASVEHLRDVHLTMAKRVAELVPPDGSVAAFDVGILAHASGRRIVDIGGLAEPGMVRAMWRGEVPALLEARGVRHAVFPEPKRGRHRFAFASRLGFDPSRMGAPLERATVSTDDLRYLAATKVAMPALALYELRAPRADR